MKNKYEKFGNKKFLIISGNDYVNIPSRSTLADMLITINNLAREYGDESVLFLNSSSFDPCVSYTRLETDEERELRLEKSKKNNKTKIALKNIDAINELKQLKFLAKKYNKTLVSGE